MTEEKRPALKLLAALRCGSGSNPMMGNCQLLAEGCWFTVREHSVPLAVETDCHMSPNEVEKWHATPSFLTSPKIHVSKPLVNKTVCRKLCRNWFSH